MTDYLIDALFRPIVNGNRIDCKQARIAGLPGISYGKKGRPHLQRGKGVVMK
jgi:hypothetical protein